MGKANDVVKLTFLGTAAANAFPEAFCRCQNCESARRAQGQSLRKRSSALVNDDLLIDLGPDIMAASQVHGAALMNVRVCLQTHPHSDHLDLSHLLSRSAEYGTQGAPRMDFFASRETLDKAAETFIRDLDGSPLLAHDTQARLNVSFHTVAPYEPFVVGDYVVTAFPASHAEGAGAMLYAVEQGGRRIFYGTDTGPLREDVWRAFHALNLRFDAVVLDHTHGPTERGTSEHMSASDVIDCVSRMRAEGILARDGRVFGTHIAHEGNPAHPELVAFARAHGYDIAYDGLVLDV